MRFIASIALATTLIVLSVSTSGNADPLPGEVLKFQQVPMIKTTLFGPEGLPVDYHGHDELSTAWGSPSAAGPTTYAGTFMADDFADKFSTPVVHVKWWGSYLHVPTADPNPMVKRFLISFEKDVPAIPGGPPSHPGDSLLNQIVSLDTDGVLKPGEGTFLENPIPGSTSIDGPIFEYNAELNLGKEFRQDPNTVYWLKIVALADINPNTPIEERLAWGWHNRDYTVMDPLASTPPAVMPGEHKEGPLPQPGGDVDIWHFQDDAVSGDVTVVIDPNMPIMPNVIQSGFVPHDYLPPYDGPPPIAQFSKDLAFALYTTPEPASCALAALALVGLTSLAPRRRA
jgi:hypothetical protein